MSPRDQSFNDRASAFWGHHRLSVEQFARIPGQRELILKLRDTFMGRSQLVGFGSRFVDAIRSATRFLPRDC
jgi:hypothetical protein